MTVYVYSKVAVYADQGEALRLARNSRTFITDTVTGAPVDVTQGARVAPYLDTDANGIADFTAENPGPLRLTTGTVFVDVYSNELPGIALAAVTAAEAAQAAAEAAAAAATGPTDATVAGLIGAATATQAAGDARWVTTARVATDTQTGLVELATTAEVTTGTDTARAVTPAGVAAAIGAWTAYTPTTNLTLGNGTLTGRYTQVGKTVHSHATLTFGSTTTVAGGYISLPLTPTGYAPSTLVAEVGMFDASTGALLAGGGFYAGGTDVYATTAAGVPISPTAPWTWAAGDTISVLATYETA